MELQGVTRNGHYKFIVNLVGGSRGQCIQIDDSLVGGEGGFWSNQLSLRNKWRSHTAGEGCCGE